MVGMNLVFNKEVQIGTDSFNNPTTEIQPITVEDCLVAPITEPQNIREEQALQQSRDQIRIHMPKTSNADVGDSNVVYDNRVFHVDSDSTKFMDGNTPTRWNRYFRAEFIRNFGSSASDVIVVSSAYWGISPSASLSADDILDLANSTTTSTRTRQFNIDGGGEYIYYAYPGAYGEAIFNVNGFLNNAWVKDEVNVQIGASNVLYYVYRTLTIQHGTGIQIGIT